MAGLGLLAACSSIVPCIGISYVIVFMVFWAGSGLNLGFALWARTQWKRFCCFLDNKIMCGQWCYWVWLNNIQLDEWDRKHSIGTQSSPYF